MIKKAIFLTCLILSSVSLGLQAESTSKVGLDIGFSQVGLSNWSSGGEESWSLNADFRGNFKQDVGNALWKQSLKIAYGITQTGEQDARKSVDEFRYESVYTFNKKSKQSAFISFLGITQLSTGEDYSTTPGTKVSYFFDPAFLTGSAGLNWQVSEKLESRVGAALKVTLAEKTTLTTSQSDLGAEWVTSYSDTLFEWLGVDSLLQVFSDFKGLSETDIYWDGTFKAKLAENINWKLNLNLVYDKDITTDTQLKQTLSLGLHFDLI